MGLFKRRSGKSSARLRVTDDIKTRKSSLQRRLSYQAANMQMKGTRERQEDSFAVLNAMDVNEIIKNGLFAVLADGMGGLQDGKEASEAAVAEFIKLFRKLDRQGDIPEQLLKGVFEINHKIFRQFHGLAGTTAVAVMIYNSSLSWVSVGDSAVYLRRDGGIFQLNQEHTYRSRLYLSEIQNDTVDRNRVETDEDAARLSEFLGIDSLEEVDYNRRELRLKAGDTLLLCSDGISGTLSPREMTAILALPPSAACAELQNAVIRAARPQQDNSTGVVIACCE